MFSCDIVSNCFGNDVEDVVIATTFSPRVEVDAWPLFMTVAVAVGMIKN
jgi:hypothetical protein